jgi:beta-xylosidase
MYRPESSNKSIVYNMSTDLINWSANNSLDFASSSGAVWAPEVHDVEGTLYLVYADPTGSNGGRDIRICKMVNPTSVGNNIPVTIVGSANDDINIDPNIYKEGSEYYLVWKNKKNGSGSRIMIRQLNSGSPTEFASGSSQTIIIPDESSWPTNKEHPCIVREAYGNNQSRYFLFYDSGQGDTQGYKVSYATSGSLMGPYTNKGVMIDKNETLNIYSIGGHSIVKDGDGKCWIVYRAKNTSDDGWEGRKPCIDRLFIDAVANTATSVATRTQSSYCPVPLP